jgi:polyhydroxyalkanoate synthesis regulator protein
MAKNSGTITIKKYANRRLYNTGTSTYVTLDDLAVMVKKGRGLRCPRRQERRRHHPFGADPDHLRAGIKDRQHAAARLLPAAADFCLWRPVADGVPSYLEHSMSALTEQQEQVRAQITKSFGDNPMARNIQLPIQLVEEQVRRNTEMFQKAMQMFSPFALAHSAPSEEAPKKSDTSKDIDELKSQLKQLQDKINSIDS